MAYSATALSAAIKAALDSAQAQMLVDIAANDPSTMKQDFCDLLATAIVNHLNAHPVQIPTGSVVVAASGAVFNASPLATQVS